MKPFRGLIYALFPSLVIWGLVIAVLWVLLSAPAARADDTPDPHTPNGATLWCLGGLGNVAMIPFCDGLRYEDGSYWHQTAASPFGFGGPAGLPWTPPVLVP